MIYKPPIAFQKKYSKAKGFTLLEAIVALALISLTGIAIFSWLNQSLTNLSTLKRHQAQTHIVQNALAYITTINPMEKPQGLTRLGALQVSWQSKIIEGPIRAVGRRGNYTNYVTGLYLLQVTLNQQNAPSYDFSVRQVGYKETPFREAL